MRDGSNQSSDEKTGRPLSNSILDLCKIVMYEFHYDYMKQKFKDLQLCYMDTDSLTYRIGIEDFYADIADDVPARLDTSSYCDNPPLPVSLNKKVTGLMKDELGGAIMTEFVALRPKLHIEHPIYIYIYIYIYI